MAIGFVAVAVVGVADLFGAPTAAQDELPLPEIVSVEPEGGVPTSELDRMPAISDDASVVAYVAEVVITTETGGAEVEEKVGQVIVRDRGANTTLRVPDTRSSHPGVSGNGCVVAYTVEVPADPDDATSKPSVELRAVDRCLAPEGGLGDNLVFAEAVVGTTAKAAPAVSADGATIVWSTGTKIVRYLRFTNAAGGVAYFADTAENFDPIADAVAAGLLDSTDVLGADVDVSADARVIAFTAGPGAAPYAPAPSNVYVWSDPDDAEEPVVELASMAPPSVEDGPIVPGAADSTGPALSADGQLLLFESESTDLLAVAGTIPVVPFVVLLDRGVGTGVLAEGVASPAISADGRHAVFAGNNSVQAVSSIGGSSFGTVSSEVVVGSPDGVAPPIVTTPSGPLVSEHGRSVVFDSPDGTAITDAPAFHTGTHVWLQLRSQSAAGEPVDLGSVEAPGELSGTAELVNTGSAGIAIESVTVDEPFELGDTTCAGVLHPGASCTAEVSIELDEAGEASGAVRVTGGLPSTEFTVELTATAVDPTTTTAEPTTTTSVTTTTIAPTTTSRPATTRPPTTRPPTTRPPTTRPPTQTTPPATTRPPVVTTTTTTTTTLPLPVVFDPASFEFAPTIIDAGRRTAVLNLVNPGSRPVTVLTIGLEPVEGSGFALDGGCVGTELIPAGSCEVGVEFAPAAEGPLAATIVVELSDATRATASLSGVGALPPVLTLTPDVAGIGQVVTISGSGFPAGIVVELSWDDGRLRSTPTVDAAGGFVETFAVLPNTIGGPTEARVEGQVDLFNDVIAELLINSTGSRSNAAFIAGFGPSFVR